MLTHHRLPVCLSVVSTDLPIWFTIKTAATLYQKDQQRFHLLLREPAVHGWEETQPRINDANNNPNPVMGDTNRLLWLEISPSRMIMTMQGNGNLSYRHLWERGVYGISRYWLQADPIKKHQSLQLRNYTRLLTLEGSPLPQYLELDYELWTEKIQLGHYVLTLQIQH
ncbi:MAG TPA: hypothetical protein DDZ80_09835 [Cyanobacteria bacterium UBA8803]|nr:hypothetical protein [Cyanobacteria bacterium UBA9273]HBL58792.1 hypothetical protein [Cyanobacteria bacterium UBA8803]